MLGLKLNHVSKRGQWSLTNLQKPLDIYGILKGWIKTLYEASADGLYGYYICNIIGKIFL